MSVPSNPKLYAAVKKEAKKKFKVWPSAYASAWLVKTYKSRGGKYRKGSKSRKKSRRKGSKSKRKSRKKSRKSKKRKKSRKSKRKSRKKSRKRKNKSGLDRWFAEKWIDVCTGKPCGRSKSSSRKYPYCRPKYRINSNT